MRADPVTKWSRVCLMEHSNYGSLVEELHGEDKNYIIHILGRFSFFPPPGPRSYQGKTFVRSYTNFKVLC